MDNLSFIKNYLDSSLVVKQMLGEDKKLMGMYQFGCGVSSTGVSDGQKVMLAGNGGSEGDLSDLVDFALKVLSDNTPHIQECHICIGHIICALVESYAFPRD